MRSFLILMALMSALGGTPAMAQFFSRGQFVRDLTMGIEWLRCSVGQRWSEHTQTCLGEMIPLDFDLIDQAITQADEQLGGGWRLPTEDELTALICMDCGIPGWLAERPGAWLAERPGAARLLLRRPPVEEADLCSG